MGYQEDALVNLDRADDAAGEGAGNLNSPSDQANYFVQRGILNALLHLADVIEAPQIAAFEQDRMYREWRAEIDAVDDGAEFEDVNTPWPLPVADDGANSVTTYNGPSEAAMVNERPSPTMTILRDDGEESAVERIQVPIPDGVEPRDDSDPLPASSIEANRDPDPEDSSDV